MERMTPAVALQLWHAIVDYGNVMMLGSDEQRDEAHFFVRQEFETLTGHRPVVSGSKWAVKTTINTTAPLN